MTKTAETTLIKLVIELAANGHQYGTRFHKEIRILLKELGRKS